MRARGMFACALVVSIAGACACESPQADVATNADVDAGSTAIPTPAGPGGGTATDAGPATPLDSGADTDAAGLDPTDASDASPPPPPPPAALVACLDAKPYVEQSCTKATNVPGWPHEALDCTYDSPQGPLHVTVADASAERVATWIVDAVGSVPAIAQLKTSDPPQYLRAMQRIATALMLQSSRIFPIEGKIGEDMGDGFYAYPFLNGVSTPCPTSKPGCYCRINSLLPGEYCDYRVGVGLEDMATCKARLGYGSGNNDKWLTQCLANHAAAWTSVTNEHIRAKTWIIARDSGISTKSSGAAVVKALDNAWGLDDGLVGQFCD